jgi:hypothetical protein
MPTAFISSKSSSFSSRVGSLTDGDWSPSRNVSSSNSKAWSGGGRGATWFQS